MITMEPRIRVIVVTKEQTFAGRGEPEGELGEAIVSLLAGNFCIDIEILVLWCIY